MGHLKVNEYIDRPDTETKFGDRKGKFADAYENFADAYESVSPLNTHALLGKRSIDDSASDIPASTRNKYSSMKYGEDGPSVSGDLMDDKNSIPLISEPLPKGSKISFEVQNSKEFKSWKQKCIVPSWEGRENFCQGSKV
ncbi:uncharacterized protein Fot_28416 [Forsythia ovata]|uniref:Uncharacterized protein n=1 Tax=Forsythia ovata TaxID=205694 RepID=A0ABD1TPT2_9LAMI